MNRYASNKTENNNTQQRGIENLRLHPTNLNKLAKTNGETQSHCFQELPRIKSIFKSYYWVEIKAETRRK